MTLEGGEGVGKSTQIRHISEILRAARHEVVTTREPGGSPGAERIREVLLGPNAETFNPMTQALLFAAARADHLATTVRPALARGAWVICDRFMDSTRAYQGAGGALDMDVITTLERYAVGETVPDLTLILDLDPAIGMARARKRLGASLDSSDPFERQKLDFHARVRARFLEIAKADPKRCAIIDASASERDVSAAIGTIMAERLLLKPRGQK